MFKHFVAALAALLLIGSAHAQKASDTLKWNADGTLSISSVVLAPNSCYTAGKAVLGAPFGERPIKNAVPVTYPIFSNRTSGMVCLQVITPLKFAITVKVPLTAQAVAIYEVVDKTQVTVRVVKLPPRTTIQ